MTGESKTNQFRWTHKREKAAMALAQGYTEFEAANEVGVSRSSIQRWKRDEDFSAEVDRLSVMVGIASRAERLRIAMRVARQKVREDGTLDTEKDLLDWLKFAQSETDGVEQLLTVAFQGLEETTAAIQDRETS